MLGLNLALAAAHFEPWIPFLHADAPERTAHAAETVSFLYANVHTANENYSALSALIDERKPQVLGLLELSGAWHEALKPQLDRYPAQAKILRDDNFGIGLFTNLTPAGEPEDFGGDIVPAFLFPLVTPGGRRIDVILLHCRPPLLDDRIYTNWLLLRRVSSRIRSSDNPLVVMGDFNATPNSRFYRNFTEWSGVQNLMHEAGWLTTWNARAPFLRFAIDHAFIKGVLPRAAPVRLPDIGSDHYPLGFEVGLQ